MRFVFLVLLVSMALQAKEATCYTVQLLSTPSSEENSQKLAKLQYDKECQVMEIGGSLTLRCGCYTSIEPAREKLASYKEAYKYAYVATSYAYRFTSKEAVKETLKHVVEKMPVLSLKEERLKLMLQSFLYSSDVKNAYKTAKIGVKEYPNHTYWIEKMAELAEWNGKEIEAVKYLNLLNKKKPSKTVETKLIKKGIGTYQFEEITDLVEKRAKEYPSIKNDKQLVYVYYQIGNPEKAAHFFEREYKRHPRKTHYLTEALEVYMEMGDLESAKRIIKIIERRHLYSLENGKLMAYFYYLKHKMQKSYAVIEKINDKREDKKYFQLKSDVGWYLKRYKVAEEASEQLIKHHQGRLVDYERVMYVNRGKDDAKVLQMALAAYEKFHESHLFYTYANKAMEQKQYKALANVISTIEAKSSALKNEANYWLVKANVYAYFHQSQAAEYAIDKALSLDPENIEIELQAIALYIEYHKQNKLKSALSHLSENSALPVAFYYPLASAYYQLQDSNKALFYLDKLLQMQASITKTVGFLFLQADIYAQRNNANTYKQTLRKIAKNLQQQKRKKPAIAQTDAFAYQYLRVQMHLMDPDSFEEQLKAAQAVLTQEHYDDLSYTWARQHGAKEKAHAIYEHLDTKALWLRFANAMQESNHSELENLLLKYLHSLAFLDASNVAAKDGQVALAQDLAFQALAKNSASQDAYITHKNLVEERSNKFESKIAYYNRDPLLRKYVELKNETYVNHGYSILSELHYYRNSSLDYNRLLYIPNAILEVNMGVKKLFNRGELGAKIGYTDSMSTYGALEVFAEYQYTKLLKLYASYAKNKKAEETTQLLIAGKKDMLSLGAKLDILASTSVNILWQNNRFNSQDGVHLGDGNYARVLVGHQIRNGYPDMRIGFFGDYGKYSETQGSKGTIDQVQRAGNAVLPKEFYNLGLDFAYGMANSALYTRVWRPFAQISTFYNSEIGNISYNVNLGYGGKLFAQDHMVVGANYTESVNGVGGSIFELFLRYQFLYMQAAMLK